MLDPDHVVEDETAVAAEPEQDAVLIEEDLLIEDVSIDGMCGVY